MDTGCGHGGLIADALLALDEYFEGRGVAIYGFEVQEYGAGGSAIGMISMRLCIRDFRILIGAIGFASHLRAKIGHSMTGSSTW